MKRSVMKVMVVAAVAAMGCQTSPASVAGRNTAGPDAVTNGAPSAVYRAGVDTRSTAGPEAGVVAVEREGRSYRAQNDAVPWSEHGRAAQAQTDVDASARQ